MDIVIDEVIEVDPIRTAVRLVSSAQLSADRIVMAPGISFDPMPGLNDGNRMRASWAADGLARQATRRNASNEVVLLTIRAAPYRCPPGPYEGACLIANWLQERKPTAKFVALDANPDIVVEKENFSRAF